MIHDFAQVILMLNSMTHNKLDRIVYLRDYMKAHYDLTAYFYLYELIRNHRHMRDCVQLVHELVPATYCDMVPFVTYLITLEDDVQAEDHERHMRYLKDIIELEHDYCC